MEGRREGKREGRKEWGLEIKDKNGKLKGGGEFNHTVVATTHYFFPDFIVQ